jgi:hypothetical protein
VPMQQNKRAIVRAIWKELDMHRARLMG